MKRGAVLALLVAFLAVALQQRRVADPHVRYDRFSLPAFDAYVHVAMAERPAVFTVAPWGYRVLAPAAAAALPGNAVQGFRRLAFLSLLAAALLLFFFMRRIGLGEAPALAGIAAFALSPPVAESLRYVFLAEPLSAALEVAFLLALASGAATGVLALLLTVWALAKELWPVFLPLVLIREWRRGPRPALVATLAAGAGPLLVTLLLRGWWWWPPAPAPAAGEASLVEAAAMALAAWRQWAGPMTLLGLAPLAIAGALRRRAPFRGALRLARGDPARGAALRRQLRQRQLLRGRRDATADLRVAVAPAAGSDVDIPRGGHGGGDRHYTYPVAAGPGGRDRCRGDRRRPAVPARPLSADRPARRPRRPSRPRSLPGEPAGGGAPGAGPARRLRYGDHGLRVGRVTARGDGPHAVVPARGLGPACALWNGRRRDAGAPRLASRSRRAAAGAGGRAPPRRADAAAGRAARERA